MALDVEDVRRAPKVLLHDHLDGGLRPGTVAELAEAAGHRLPVDDPAELAGWFASAGHGGGLERYLGCFAHTLAVLQTPEALQRAARECAEDLAADGIVYAEVRFAPELHQQRGVALDEIVEAVGQGLADGAAGTDIVARMILCAMRDRDCSRDVAQLALRHRDRGVAGFDLAGPEAGHRASRHAPALELLRREGVPITLHAGEGDGLASIADALAHGAGRLGHGLRLIDDISLVGDDDAQLGPLAAEVLRRRVPLEMCPTSNVHTGTVGSIEVHPVERLRRLGFLVTISTDNRLMSDITLSGELARLASAFSYTWEQIDELTRNALDAAFLDPDERARLARRLSGVTPEGGGRSG